MNRIIFLYLELFTFFISLPVSVAIFNITMNGLVIPVLIIFSAICLFIILHDKNFDNKTIFNFNRAYLKYILRRWIIGSIVLIPLVYIFLPIQFFRFPLENFNLWIMVIILYPLLSVYPQEIIFRSFFFHRYKMLFNSNAIIIMMSGISFGLAHLFFDNWIAPLLSLGGGILFAITYSKSNSLLMAAIEHGLWGDLIFTIGLGNYFYSGAN